MVYQGLLVLFTRVELPRAAVVLKELLLEYPVENFLFMLFVDLSLLASFLRESRFHLSFLAILFPLECSFVDFLFLSEPMIVPFAELFFPVSAVELSFLRFFLVLFFVELFSLSFVIFPVPLPFVGIFLLPTILATCVAEEVVPT